MWNLSVDEGRGRGKWKRNKLAKEEGMRLRKRERRYKEMRKKVEYERKEVHGKGGGKRWKFVGERGERGCSYIAVLHELFGKVIYRSIITSGCS
jgi:hypothetical protein